MPSDKQNRNFPASASRRWGRFFGARGGGLGQSASESRAAWPATRGRWGRRSHRYRDIRLTDIGRRVAEGGLTFRSGGFSKNST